MNFNERLKIFLGEEEVKPNESGKVNKDPESQVKPEKALEISKDVKTLKQFFTLVNPLRGEVKRSALFRYIKEFRQRGKDVIILKNKNEVGVELCPGLYPFFAVNRTELSAFLASIMEDEGAMKDFANQIETIYTQEETELQPVDYIDFVIKNKISIMTNPAEESFGVDTPSDSVPTNMTPKNQEDLSVKPKEVEDSEGIDKSQEKEEE
jgi:hypothetical protein